MTDDPTDLARERRLRRKINRLGVAIDASPNVAAYHANPIDYLRERAEPMMKQVYTVKDVAELLDVTGDTVRRWCRDGELEAAKLGSGGYRISRHALAAFWRERGGGALFADADADDEGVGGDNDR